MIGAEGTEDQKIMWNALATEDRVSIKSGNGVGKSMGAGLAALWFLNCFRPSIVITTAPTERQVKEILWREIRYWHAASRLKLEGIPLMMKLDISPKHYALGFTTSPESQQQLQGIHGANLMVIIDEANGYPSELYEPIEGLLVGGNRNILFQIGNPLVPAGKFHESFSDGMTWNHTISCLDHPNVVHKKNIIPGAVTYGWVEKQRKLWGEDSPFWQSRILGQFPKYAENLVINLVWIEIAEKLKITKKKKEEKYLGFDPGEYGTDDYVWFVGTLRERIETVTRKGIEPAEAIGITKQLIDKHKIPHKNASIDGIGVGATMYSVLKEDKYMINRFVASENALDSKTFEDRSTEAYFNLRKLLNPHSAEYNGYAFNGKIEKLKADLCCRKFKTSRYGRYMLVPKEQFRKDYKRSPNWGDAMAICYSVLCKRSVYDFVLLPDVIGE